MRNYKCSRLKKTTLSEKTEGYLVYISLSNNKDKLAVLLHHSAVLQDALHLHHNLLAPGGVQGMLGAGLQHLLPQQPVFCVRKEENVVRDEGLIWSLLVNVLRHSHKHSLTSVIFWLLFFFQGFKTKFNGKL